MNNSDQRASANYSKWWLLAVLIISVSSLLVTLSRSPVSFDAFWHLQMGKDWILNGLSPWVDHYSFTYPGREISAPPVIFQVLLFSLVAVLGISAGFLVYKALAVVFIFGAASALLRRLNAPLLLIALAIPALVFLFQLRSTVRPELLSYGFSILLLMVYFDAKGELTGRTVALFFGLMVLWTNYHSSIIGFVICAGYFLDCAARQLSTRAGLRTWAAWLGSGLLILSSGFLNPSLSHPLLEALSFPHEWKFLITEYRLTQVTLRGEPGIYAMGLIALVTPVLALRLRRFGDFLIWGVLALTAFSIQRMVAPAGIVMTLMLVHLLISAREAELSQENTNLKTVPAFAMYILMVALLLISNVERAYRVFDENERLQTRYPSAVVDYMKDHNIQGRVFNEYGIGGYLIYGLSPGSTVYIDGRTQILYPVAHMQRYQQSLRDSAVLSEEHGKYDFDLVIQRFNQPNHDLISSLGSFGLDFVGPEYALYRKQDANFSGFGRLMHQPACWDTAQVAELGREHEQMQMLLPRNSALLPFANFVLAFIEAEDQRQFFDQSISSSAWDDTMRRFAASRFAEWREFDISRLLLAGIEAPRTGDKLAVAVVMTLAGDLATVSSVFAEVNDRDWDTMSPRSAAVVLGIFESIGQARELDASERGRVAQLITKLEASAGAPVISELSVDSICEIERE